MFFSHHKLKVRENLSCLRALRQVSRYRCKPEKRSLAGWRWRGCGRRSDQHDGELTEGRELYLILKFNKNHGERKGRKKIHSAVVRQHPFLFFFLAKEAPQTVEPPPFYPPLAQNGSRAVCLSVGRQAGSSLAVQRQCWLAVSVCTERERAQRGDEETSPLPLLSSQLGVLPPGFASALLGSAQWRPAMWVKKQRGLP